MEIWGPTFLLGFLAGVWLDGFLVSLTRHSILDFLWTLLLHLTGEIDNFPRKRHEEETKTKS